MNRYINSNGANIKCLVACLVLRFLTNEAKIQCLAKYTTQEFNFKSLNNTSIQQEYELSSFQNEQQYKEDNISEILSNGNKYHICSGNFCIPKNYNRFALPNSESTQDVLNIRIDFDITDILEVDDKDFSVTFKAYLGVYWEDPRLTDTLEENDGFISVDHSMLSKIWVPDIYIYNLKSIEVLSILRRFEGKLESFY